MTSQTPSRVQTRPFCLLALLAATTAAAQQPPRTAALIPDDFYLTVTLRDGSRLLEELRGSDVLARYLAGEAYAALEAQPDFLKAKGGAFLFAGAAGIEPWTLAGHLLGKELTLAVGPRGGQPDPDVLVVMRAGDVPAVRRIVDVALAMSGAAVNGEPAEGRSREVDGVRGYSLNDKAFLAQFDDFVVFSNRAAMLERVVRDRGKPEGKLARHVSFVAAAEAAPDDAAAWAWLDIAVVRRALGERFDKKLDNALGAMLFAGWLDAAKSADGAVAWLSASGKGLALAGRLLALDTPPPGEARPPSAAGLPQADAARAGLGGKQDDPPRSAFFADADALTEVAALEIPGLMGQIALARDWIGLWDQRDAMMDPDGLRGLAQFASTLTTLMGSLDFSGELLPGLNPSVQFVAARQAFDGPPPTPELPGFALLLHLKDPGKLTPRLENAAMMAMSIVNVDRGQKMQPQYHMDLAEHAGTRMLVTRFAEQTEPGPRGLRFNFEPSFAGVGDRFVICTSRGMLEDIIDALKRDPPAGRATSKPGRPEPAADSLTIDLRELGKLLGANREVFITNRMLESDLPREKAEQQVGAVLDAAQLLSGLVLRLERTDKGVSFETRLTLSEPDKADRR